MTDEKNIQDGQSEKAVGHTSLSTTTGAGKAIQKALSSNKDETTQNKTISVSDVNTPAAGNKTKGKDQPINKTSLSDPSAKPVGTINVNQPLKKEKSMNVRKSGQFIPINGDHNSSGVEQHTLHMSGRKHETNVNDKSGISKGYFKRKKKKTTAAQLSLEKSKKQSESFFKKAMKRITKEINVKTTASFLVPIALFVFIIIVVILIVSSCMVSSLDMLTSYQTEDTTITETNSEMRALVDNMREEVETIEQNPAYSHIDEFRYIPSLQAIINALDYDYFKVTAYFSAMYQNYEFTNIQAELNQIFNELFQLQLTEITETDSNGDDWYVLEIELIKGDIDKIIEQHIGNNATAKEIYNIYMGSDIMGGHQIVANPVRKPWTHMISSYYGSRYLEHMGENFHDGLDIAYGLGTPVYAGVNGIVSKVTTTGAYGKRVNLQNADGTITVLYAHMSVISVSQGDPVYMGQKIGEIGTTGNSTGPHLHIEVFINGVRLDPLPLIQQDTSNFIPNNTSSTSSNYPYIRIPKTMIFTKRRDIYCLS